MDEERWIQDNLAIRMGSHLIAEAEEHGVDLSSPAHVIITSPGDEASRRTSLAEVIADV